MSILVREKSRIKLFQDDDEFFNFRSEDMSIDHLDDIHVRIIKLFPLCSESREPEITSYKRFHLRFYIPVNVYQDKFKKLDKCFILFNGLDEIDHLTLYDQIGKGLCRHGYAAVLLPLPDHLNRNMVYRHNDLSKRKRPSTSFLEEPEKIYEAYWQINSEVKVLITHLVGKCKAKRKKDCCAFFDQYFAPKLSISLLGYSIGGLVALSNFLIQKFTFNSCILLNSGAKLEDIDVSEFQVAHKWKQTVKALNKAQSGRHNVTRGDNLFDMVFLGNRLSLLKDELQEKSKRILFVLGGADSVTKYKSIREIEPSKHGLATLQLPGIHHFLSIDTYWDQWFPVVNEMIRCFDESAAKESLLPNDILGSLAYFQLKYRISDRLDHLDIRRVTDTFERDSLARTLYAAKGTYGKINLAFNEMYKLMARALKRPNLYPDYIVDQCKHLFGSIAINKFGIDRDIINKAIDRQHELAKEGKPITRIGNLLLEEGVLTESQIEETICEQRLNCSINRA